MRTIIAIASLLQCTWAFGEGLLDRICSDADRAEETASRIEYNTDPKAYADDFCALARFDNTGAAARQLGKMLSANRRLNNTNRFYFNPFEFPNEKYIQLLRPDMEEMGIIEGYQFRFLQTTERIGSIRFLYTVFTVQMKHESLNRWYSVDEFSFYRSTSSHYLVEYGNAYDNRYGAQADYMKIQIEERLDNCLVSYRDDYLKNRDSFSGNRGACP